MNAKRNQSKYAELALALHTCEDDYESARLVEDLSALLLGDEEITKSQAPSLWYEIDSREHGVVDLFHSDGCVRIDLGGVVDHFPNDSKES